MVLPGDAAADGGPVVGPPLADPVLLEPVTGRREDLPESVQGRVKSWQVFALITLVGTLNGFGLSVMPVAVPAIVRAFPHMSAAQASWISNAFTIVGAATMTTGGVLAERWGRKQVLLAGVAIFVVASLLGAFSRDPTMIIAARAGLALGGALYSPAGIAIMVSVVPANRIALGIAFWSAAAGASSAFGPVFGGALIDALGWQWVFWLNVPLAAVVLVFAPKVLPATRSRREEPLPDPVGVAMLILGLSVLVLGVAEGSAWGWGSGRTLGSLFGGLAILALFVWRCLRHPNPVVDLHLLRVPTVAAGGAGVLVFGIGFWCVDFGVLIYMILRWGYSATDAGLVALPIALVGGVTGIVSGGWAARYGYRVFAISGSLCTVVVGVGVMWLARHPDEHWLTIPLLCVLGYATGVTYNVYSAFGMLDLPRDQHAVGTGVNLTLNRLGATIGVALGVTLVQAGSDRDQGLFVVGIIAIVTSLLSVAVVAPIRR